MNEHVLTGFVAKTIRAQRKGAVILLFSFTALTGCVQVAAPDKPIEINLNIKIEQEVVLRIEEAVNDAIAENSEIF